MTRLSALAHLLPLLAILALPARAGPIGLEKRQGGKDCPTKGGPLAGGDSKPQWAGYHAQAQGQGQDGIGAKNSWGGGGGTNAEWRSWKGKQSGNEGDATTGQAQGDENKGGNAGEDVVWVDVTVTETRNQPAPTNARQAPPPQTDDPVPTPSPAPAPAPAPSPDEQPAPAPAPAPAPSNEPEPAPQPSSEPAPVPAPAPAPAPAPQPSSNPVGDQQAWVDAHTQARAQYGQAGVTWSDGAYQQAKANADAAAAGDCNLQHTKEGKYGENLFWAWASDNNGARPPSEVVGSWMSEAKDFDYNNPENTAGISTYGHFTAIVWTDVKAVGCYAAQCSNNRGTYVACCYDPFPNVIGQFGAKVPRPV